MGACLVIELVQKGAEEDECVVLSTDLCQPPALPHRHGSIWSIIPQPYRHMHIKDLPSRQTRT